MNDNPKAGLSETGLGRLDGLEKESTQEEVYQEEVRLEDLAQRMASWNVQKHADLRELSEDVKEELLAMLDLPRTVAPPTDAERAQLPQNLPRVIAMDTRAPNDHVVPEKRFSGFGNRPW